MKMKFDKFVELKESAIILSGNPDATLSEYKDHMNEAEIMKAEIKAFEKELAIIESIDYSDILNEDVSDDDEYLLEGAINEDEKESKLKTSTNPIARLFRWRATLVAKKKIDGVYKKVITAIGQIIANEVKVELKKEEVSKIAGPEAKAKLKELSALEEKAKLQKEQIQVKKKDALDKIRDPGFFSAGSSFGFNGDVLDKHVALKNIEEAIAMNELRLKAAQNVLTDKEMTKIKESVKQLKAREAKYAAEVRQTEDAVKNAIEKNDYTDADNDIKAEKEDLEKKIDDVEVDIQEYRDKMTDETDDEKKEDYARNLAALEKNKKGYARDMEKLAKKAKKVVLGSSGKEE